MIRPDAIRPVIPSETTQRLVAMLALGCLAGTLFVLAQQIWHAPQRVMPDGAPVAHDFSLFWSIGRLVRAEGVLAAYDLARIGEVSTAEFGARAFIAIWPYPPPMATIVAQFSALPYPLALFSWSFLPFLALIAWVGLATRSGFAMLIVAGSPVVLTSQMIGQSAMLITFLLAVALHSGARGRGAAGLAAGALLVKPHLAVILPVAYLSGRHWRPFWVATLIVGLSLAASLALQGPGAWQAWQRALARAAELASVAGVDGRLPSLLAAGRMIGAGPTMAWAMQIAGAILVLAVTAWLWRGKAREAEKVAVGLAAVPLVPPYLWFYDCLGPALAFALLVSRPGKSLGNPAQFLLTITWLAPIANIFGGIGIAFPIMAIAHILAFAVVAWEAKRSANPPAGSEKVPAATKYFDAKV